MNRILTLLLCVIMVFGVSVTASAAIDSSEHTMVVLPENFTIPADYNYNNGVRDFANNGWSPLGTNNGDTEFGTNNNGLSYWGDKGGLYPNFLTSRKGAVQSYVQCTAKFYVPQDGDYHIWALAFRITDTIAENRHCRIGFDDPYVHDYSKTFTVSDRDARIAIINNYYDSAIFQNGDNKSTVDAGFKWVKGKDTHTLTKGWHTVDIVSPTVPSGVNMIVLTTDDNLVLDESTTWEELSPYTDITTPAVNGTVSAEFVDSTSVRLTFPEVVADSGSEVIKTCYINDKIVTTDSNDLLLDNLTPLTKIDVKVEIADVFGNIAGEYELKVPVSSTSCEDVTVKDEGGDTISSITDLANADTVKASMTVRSFSGETIPVKIGIGIYGKDFKRMYDFKWISGSVGASDSTVYSDTLNIPDYVKASPADYAIRMFVWKDAGVGNESTEPLVAGLTIKEDN